MINFRALKSLSSDFNRTYSSCPIHIRKQNNEPVEVPCKSIPFLIIKLYFYHLCKIGAWLIRPYNKFSSSYIKLFYNQVLALFPELIHYKSLYLFHQ